MSRVDRWLDERIRPPTRIGPAVLVLCRTDATLHTVRSWLARQGGLAGIDVATPRSLCAQLQGPWLDPPPPADPDLPDHPFADRIRTRPGLVALARARVRDLRLHRLADPGVTGPPWLEQLADSPWEADVSDAARLLALARRWRAANPRSRGVELTPSLAWGRVVALGFAGVPLDPWTREVHRARVGEPDRPGARRAPTDALGVPDTAAEARLAAAHAVPAPHDTVVLVEHDATAARIHRALERAGVPSAWRATTRLERHTLASVVRRCVPWFHGASDPNVRATDLHEVLRHPMVLGRLPPPAQAWLEQRLTAVDADPARTALSPRGVASAIRRARHLDAPLSRWIAELEGLTARTDEAGVPERALRLLARVKVLDACVRGVPFTEVFPVGGPEEDADWGDFDALVADLLGDQDPTAPAPIAPPGTLGALRRFLLACRIRTAEDPASLRILGALRRGADRPASRLEALQVLQGVVEKGEVHPGVEILAYEDYDGRPCTTLILADLHDQGVAARPSPDPLLSDAEIERLGLLDARARVSLRLERLGCACAMADRVVGIVTARDAMGRAVVPPVQLGLSVVPVPTGAYGLELDAPERPLLRALDTVDAAPDPPRADDPRLAHLAIQATAEWSRAGLGPIGAPARLTRASFRSTLGHHLLRRPTPPAWLAPWLGDASDVPEAHLGDGERSASSFFAPLTHCLYQAYARAVLDLRPPDDVNEELDPREIGNAAHDALQAAALRGAWSHDGDPTAVADAFTHDLRSATKPAFDAARDRFGALSPARLAATEGLERRWASHWDLYARSRSRRGTVRPDDWAAGSLILEHPWMDTAVDDLAESARQAGLPAQDPWTLRYWLKDASGVLSRGDRFDSEHELCAPRGSRGLPHAWAPLLASWLDHPRMRRLVDRWRDLRERSIALSAPSFATVAELPFGGDEPPVPVGTMEHSEPVRIAGIRTRFKDHDVDLRGFVDRISLVGDPAAPLLRIVDYKTGRNAPDEREAKRRLRELTDPQLVVYALAVRQAIAEGQLAGPFANGRVATLGWDHVRATDDARALLPPRDGHLVDDVTLDGLARALGMLVEHAKEGRWALSPHPRTCPETNGWGHDHCPYAGACRLRDLAAVGTGDEE